MEREIIMPIPIEKKKRDARIEIKEFDILKKLDQPSQFVPANLRAALHCKVDICTAINLVLIKIRLRWISITWQRQIITCKSNSATTLE